MGLMDKVKAQATQLAQKTQETARGGIAKFDQVQANRQADAMLRNLGALVYAERTERGAPDSQAQIDRLIQVISEHEAQNGINLAVQPADQPGPDAGAPGFPGAAPGGDPSEPGATGFPPQSGPSGFPPPGPSGVPPPGPSGFPPQSGPSDFPQSGPSGFPPQSGTGFPAGEPGDSPAGGHDETLPPASEPF